MNEENYNGADWAQDCCGRQGTDGGVPSGGTASGGQDILSCLPLPASCCTLLRRLRAPGVCLSYRISKRSIPDMDAAQTAGAASDSACFGGDCPDGGDSTGDCTCGDDCTCTDTCGCQGGVMTSSGSITFRLFDAALVCMAGMLVCGVCCLCGKMKK